VHNTLKLEIRVLSYILYIRALPLDLVPKSVNFIKDFKINGTNLIPDALIHSSFSDTSSIVNKKNLSPSDWDDFDYKTKFRYEYNTFTEAVKIAYVGQTIREHTNNGIEKLETKFPLPKNFHSYWEINWNEGNLSLDQWQAMKDLNHIFYTSLHLGIHDFSEFCNKILIEKLRITVKESRISGNNVFIASLFRFTRYSDLESQFNSFMAYILSDMLQFEVIDIKYMTLNYIQNPKNISAIRERSVRKQFVYEYLLQAQTKALNQKSSPSISSSFWLPDASCEKEVLSDGPKYLDGYLKLVTVDVESVIRSYVS
jgi:hypothetical protein